MSVCWSEREREVWTASVKFAEQSEVEKDEGRVEVEVVEEEQIESQVTTTKNES